MVPLSPLCAAISGIAAAQAAEPLPQSVKHWVLKRAPTGPAVDVLGEREGGSRMVQAGDIIDAAYRVEAIERNRALPDEVPLGAELPVALGIPSGSAAASATIELTYDAEVLSLSGARIVRPGKALVEVSAQDETRAKEIRLRAIAETTERTQIGIAVSAVDAQHIVNFIE